MGRLVVDMVMALRMCDVAVCDMATKMELFVMLLCYSVCCAFRGSYENEAFLIFLGDVAVIFLRFIFSIY